ncbi:hypothetical protein GGR40_002481 [Novosphingobium gossypii]
MFMAAAFALLRACNNPQRNSHLRANYVESMSR